ncbi:LOW QUALITY PROTEIN: RNA-binding motif protein, X-linked 2-like [Xyrauchen texanus]|uniref:LOW QUALITY PROTEIN: RNA-binding motif protein, X-linked 2-like n=1 Tax=Xyrauchen texanus TaxID=154827 RepID=UPI002242040D|nr:LOW QUALITY PROTEIN: RNA-binding motif protein, X-linked 2-like [Xyrauchen texanus]
MNPLTKVKLINELNEREAELGVKDNVSWHSTYKDSAWIFIGGFPYELTEGDIICVFSQYGEIANINLVRDKKTGKSKGFCFLCYEDQRSTILAVDNFNGIKIKGRTIRVDHVANYRPPKDTDDIDDITEQLRKEGCAPKLPPPSSDSESEEDCAVPSKKQKKDKKEKKKKKKKEEKGIKGREAEARTEMSTSLPVKVKKEKEDEVYEKYAIKGPAENRRDRPGQESRGQPQYREEELERVRDRHRDDRRVERDRDKGGRSIDRSRGEKRHEDTQQRDNRDKGRGSNGERERERDGGRDRDRERDQDKGRDRDRDRSREGEHRRN